MRCSEQSRRECFQNEHNAVIGLYRRTLTIFPNNKEDANLYKQLAKRLNNKVIVTKESDLKSKERISEDPFFDDPRNLEKIEKGISDMKAGRVKKIKDPNNIWESIQ